MNKLQLFAEIGFNVIFPLVGIFCFGWSIGDIFLLFFLEILIRGGVTTLKILGSAKTGYMARVGNIFYYFMGFSMLLLLMLMVSGNYFNGADKQMDTSLTTNTVYILVGSYFITSLLPFFISGEFKTSKARKVIGESIKCEGALFLCVLVTLIICSTLTHFVNVNYVLATGLVVGKNAAGLFIQQKLKLA
jgi:hypothetical protein